MKLGRNPLFLSLAFAVLAMCQSCTVGVDYRNPDLNIPDAWAASVAGQATSAKSPLERWWKGFNDPTLNECSGAVSLVRVLSGEPSSETTSVPVPLQQRAVHAIEC